MALKTVSIVSPCLSYQDFGSCFPAPAGPPWWVDGYGPVYNGYLVTCPRHYLHSMSSIAGFIYDPGADLLRLIVWVNQFRWPGWGVVRYDFDPATGAMVAGTVGESFWAVAYSSGGSCGSYGKIYSTFVNAYDIAEIDPLSFARVAGGWSINPMTFTPQSLYNHAIVNRIDQYLAGSALWTIDCWKNIGSTPQLFQTVRIPGPIAYMTYENRNYLWVVCSDGTIAKLDYTVPRWEMISSVQNPTPNSLGYALAFDTKRKQVVVFRWLPDAADGTATSQLEFYYPTVEATLLTQPVPVSSLRAGNKVNFVSHLIGTAGEGVTPYMANSNLVPPASGTLLTPYAGTELSGRVSLRYAAPDAACTDTLEVEVDTSN